MTRKIDIEKLTREEDKKHTTKITAIVILGIVFALALFILISSVATVGLNPRFVARPDEIHVYKAGSSSASGQITKEDELYDDFMEYYDNMFSSSFLSALFNGRLSGYTLSQKQVSTASKVYDNFTNPYVKFKYDDPIELTYKNGSEYKSAYDKEKTVTFKELYFEIAETDTLHDFKIYVVDYEASQSSQRTYYVEVNLVANTSDLHENISDFYNSLIG